MAFWYPASLETHGQPPQGHDAHASDRESASWYPAAAAARLISKKTTKLLAYFKNHDNRYSGQVFYFKKTDRRPSQGKRSHALGGK